MAKDKAAEIKTVKVKFTQVTPCHFSHESTEFHLFHGEEYELPLIGFVQLLIDLGHLTKA